MAWPRCVAVIGAFNPDMPNDANAKLIAAAPELVEALSELLEYAVILGADYLDTFRDWPADATIQGWPKERWIRAREAEDKARAALAKAGARDANPHLHRPQARRAAQRGLPVLGRASDPRVLHDDLLRRYLLVLI